MRTAFPEETPPGAVARHHPLLFHSGFRRLGSHQATPKSHGISFVSLTVKPVGKPDAGNPPVRLCVQRRLACSVGDKPTEAKVRSLVAWIARRKDEQPTRLRI